MHLEWRNMVPSERSKATTTLTSYSSHVVATSLSIGQFELCNNDGLPTFLTKFQGFLSFWLYNFEMRRTGRYLGNQLFA